MHKHVELKSPKPFEASLRLKSVLSAMIFVGLLAFIVCLMTDASRAWQAYLTSLFYFVSLAAVGLFYVAIQFLTKAGWSVLVRRVFESFTAYLPLGAMLTFVFALFGGSTLYTWFNPEYVLQDPLLLHKQAYLNPTFFGIRLVIFFGGWILFQKLIVGSSVLQDKNGDKSLVESIVPKCVAYIVFFALSYSLFSVDLIMALEPHWFSTIFGVYLFGGTSQAFFALAILITIYLIRGGYYNGLVNENHVHDMAKFMLGFTVFWAYISFSQFMLIWYANLPEETIFFKHRMEGGWAIASVLLVMFKFVIPFLALLPRWTKRDFNFLSVICVMILITQFFDIHWLIYPNFNDQEVLFSLWEVAIFAGFAGTFGIVVTRFLSQNSLVPMHDVFLQESADHQVHY
jgi:hypothetical protein